MHMDGRMHTRNDCGSTTYSHCCMEKKKYKKREHIATGFVKVYCVFMNANIANRQGL